MASLVFLTLAVTSSLSVSVKGQTGQYFTGSTPADYYQRVSLNDCPVRFYRKPEESPTREVHHGLRGVAGEFPHMYHTNQFVTSSTMQLIFKILIVIVISISLTDAQTSCLQCSTDDPGCDQGTFPPTECAQQDDSCYSLTISGGFILERGCLSTLSGEKQAKCTDPDDQSCTICSQPGGGCNREQWHKCHQCSKSSNSNCALHPNRVSFCLNYTVEDRCYAMVVGDELIRGCQSDLEPVQNVCEGNKYCITCEDDSCNDATQSELKSVTRCVQCKEGEFRCVEGSTTNSECDERDDRCYIKMWKDGELDRGCVKKLNQDEQDRCSDESDRSCYSCSGRQCNNHRWLKCFQCIPGQNATCAEEQTNGTLSYYCGSFDLNDRCYSKLINFEVTRGCASDLGVSVDPCEGNAACVSCSTDGCNSISEAYIKDAANHGRHFIRPDILR